MVSRAGLATVAALVLAACGGGSELGADVEDQAVGPSVAATAEDTPVFVPVDDERGGDGSSSDGGEVRDGSVGPSVAATAEDTPDPAPSTMTVGGEDSSGDSGVVRHGDLDGRVFVARSIEGRELVPGSPVLLPFHDGSLFTLNGCNAITGSYSIDIEMQTMVMVGEGGTEVACEDALMEQDDLVMEMLTAGPMPVTLDGGELVFDTPSGRITFVEGGEIADSDAGSGTRNTLPLSPCAPGCP